MMSPVLSNDVTGKEVKDLESDESYGCNCATRQPMDFSFMYAYVAFRRLLRIRRY